MIKLEHFCSNDFELFKSWIDSKELLSTIAGNDLVYPLDNDQLQNYMNLNESQSFTIIYNNKKIGHVEIVQTGYDTYKIDKLIIGEKSSRGLGLGKIILKEIEDFSFNKLNAKIIELNVFEWNFPAINCYKKCGFVINHKKQKEFNFHGQKVTIINMTKSR